jgi:putative MATE family efflux protein
VDYKQKRELILNGPMLRVIISLSGPVMLTNFIQTLYNLVDTYFVGWLGTAEIAAVQFIWPVIFLMMSIGMGLSLAATSLIFQYTGAHEYEASRKVAAQILSLSTLLSITIGIVGYLASGPLLHLMQATGVLYTNAKMFIEVIFLGLPSMFLMFSYTAIKTGLGDTYTPMKISALSAITNMFLDPLFMFTLGFGLRGAAIATVLARAIFGIYAVCTLFNKSGDFHIHIRDLKLDFKILKQIVKIGLPSSFGQSMTSLGFMIMNVFIVSYGQATLTAFAIGNRISGLILMPAMGVGNALASIVGQNIGADNLKRAKEAVRTSTLVTSIVLVAGGAIIVILSENIIRLFSTDPFVVAQGTFYLRLITASLPLMGIYQILIGTFQGSGHTVYAMIMMLGRLWFFRLPLIILLGKLTDWGSNAVWYSMITSNFLICVVGGVIYFSGKWHEKTITLTDSPEVSG